MIVATLTDGTIILGLDEENINRLKAGKPIVKDLSNFGGSDEVVIVYGATLTHIMDQLKDTFGELPLAISVPPPGGKH